MPVFGEPEVGGISGEGDGHQDDEQDWDFSARHFAP
jgi:hypothetical protein